MLRGHLAVLDAAGRSDRRDHLGHVLADAGVRASALALIDTVAGVVEGDEIAVDVRGRRMRVRVVKPPFVPSHVR